MVIIGSQLLKLAMQYCCAWGMWNISSYAINPKKKKIQKYLSKTFIFFWGLGFGTYHVRFWNYAVDKNGDRNDPQTHNHCHSYFSHFSVSVSFTESLQLWDPCWAHPMTRGLSMWVQIKTGFWLYCTTKSSLLMKRQKQQTSLKKTLTRNLN